MKQLILIRHAHRNKLEDDNGLSEKGEKQAERLRKVFRKGFEEGSLFGKKAEAQNIRIFSSPKRRCRETLEPLAEYFARPIEVDPRLDEQGSEESNRGMQKRLTQFLEDWQSAGARESTWVACSHGDWIPLALDRLLGASISLNKGAFAVLRLDSDQVSLYQLTQDI